MTLCEMWCCFTAVTLRIPAETPSITMTSGGGTEARGAKSWWMGLRQITARMPVFYSIPSPKTFS